MLKSLMSICLVCFLLTAPFAMSAQSSGKNNGLYYARTRPGIGKSTATGDTTRNTKATNGPGEKLAGYKRAHITEKAYLHFDKPYYAAGDTIYFKAYVTMNERHWLTQLSGVLHVEFINTQNKIDQSLLLKINNGVCWGDFSLPDSLARGDYRVRAYTNLMRNGDEAGFFIRTIPVVSPLADKIPESGGGLPGANKPDLQLLPEGGGLVAGLRSRVAFKAIGVNGLGSGVKGTVTDSTGKVITTFASTHLGMGAFEIMPDAGKNYKANLTFANGYQTTINLPAVQQSGITLAVDNDSLQKVSVIVKANAEYIKQNKNKEYKVIVYSGGLITVVNCALDSSETRLDIAKRRMRTGINTVTLFSPDNEPLAERLFFIQNYDKLNLDVKSDKTTYNAREKIDIRLNAKNRADSVVAGHFSVSVTDESIVPVDENNENTILSSLLLTDDLKGTVEQPGYYFSNTSDTTLKNLDLVMLTHGYRNFEWKEILKGDNQPLKYHIEKGLDIAGNATTVSGRPLAKGTISLIAPGIGGPVLTTETNEKGDFRFPDLEFNDTTKFILQAVNNKGNNNTLLAYKAGIPVPVTAMQYYEAARINTGFAQNNYAITHITQPYTHGPITGKMLKQVNINAHKDVRPKATDRYGPPDYTIQGKDILFGGSLTDRIEYRIPGVIFPKTRIGNNAVAHKRNTMKRGSPPMRVVVDGIEMPPDFDINSISTALVDKIDVMTNVTVNDTQTEGALLITLKHGWSASEIPSKGILPITAIGFYKAREFYSPKYESPDTGESDFRSTIYWKPELLTDTSGKASFTFYNVSRAGIYRVVVEGIDENGNIGRQVYRYTVK